MKVAILAESAYDEEALRIIVDGVLGIQTQIASHTLQSRGWPSVRDGLPAVIRRLHFCEEADALLVVVDADRSSLKAGASNNRRDALEAVVKSTLAPLRPISYRPVLSVVVGVAMPALEAWFLSSTDAALSEANWEQSLAGEIDTDVGKRLKRQLFGVERPDSVVRREKFVESAHRCIPHLSVLRERFPNGFGKMVEDILAWRKIG